MAVIWPISVLKPQEAMFHLRGMNISGPVSGSGAADVISGDAPFWVASFGSVVVTTKERRLSWRGVAAKLQGRINTIIVPYCRRDQPLISAPTGEDIPHSDDTFFDDDTGYDGSDALVRTVTDLQKDAVSAVVQILVSGEIVPGHVFSFGDRLYEIRDVVGSQLVWNPPLREAVPAGTELNFRDPRCRMRLASDDEMMLRLDMGRRGFPTVNFVEDLVS
jgi:hypothetical protein